MAKDRDKQQATLFGGAGGAGGGVDDKSISFQRAVFIVCNLRRLIKRPKREDKNSIGASGGSRKRSGGGTADQRNADCSLLGPAGCQDQTGALGVDGTVVGHYVGGKLRFRNPIRRAFTLPTILCGSLGSGEPATDEQWRGPDEYQDEDQDEDQDQGSGKVGDQSGEETGQGDNHSLSSRSPGDSSRRRATRGNQPADATRRLSPASDCDREGSLTPLSCLVTPIRRVTPAAGNSSDKLMRRADCNQRPPTDCHRNTNLNQLKMMAAPAQADTQLSCSLRDLSGRTAKTAANLASGAYQPALCCPIWQLAMELLDQSQAQPRDQTHNEQLLGAPSRLGYLLAPTCLERRATSSLARASADSGQSSQTGDDPDQDQDQEECERSSGSELDTGQIGRLRGRGFSNSALCLNDEPAGGGGGGRSGARPRNRAQNQSPEAPRASRPTVAGGAQTRPIITVSGALAAPVEDPIVKLARLRRPSVSNQGSLNVDQQALFSAVECNQLERVKSILDEAKVNVNSLNGDKLTCLDVAVLLRNPAMVRLLQQYNAKESSAYLSAEGRENQLYSLYMEARRLVEDLSRSIGSMAQPGQTGEPSGPSQAGNASEAAGQASCACQEQQQLMLATGSLLSSALFEEKQRQLQYWRRRLDLFMQMRYGFEKLDVPSVPELVVLQVVGENSLGFKIVHSLGQINELFDSLSRQQQQRPQTNRQTSRMHQTTSGQVVRPMSMLIAAAKERRLRCLAGAKCSHWQMDELVVYRQSSDQFQMHDPDDPLLASEAGDDSAGRWHQQRDTAARLPQRDRRARMSSQSQQQLQKSRQQQEKLAVFNQLLAQQLAILSREQQLELLQGSRPKAVHVLSQQQQHQLIYAHQIESTDSAYDCIAAAVAGTRQQQVFARPSGGSTAAGAPLNLRTEAAAHQQPVVYHSLAYQLMSARRVQHQNLRLDDGEAQGARTRGKLQPSNSVKLHNNQQEQAEFITDGDSFEQQSNLQQPLEVIRVGDSSVVQLQTGPRTTGSSASNIITKYCVEWSLNSTFEPIEGSMIVYNTSSSPLECQIGNLDNGRLYFVRVSSGNHKGFSASRPATPICLAPSSWRQVVQRGGGSTAGSRSSQAPSGSCATSSLGPRKKFKYDEEVFKKFTKLILLNKHILDENQLNWLQREQQRIQQETQMLGGGGGGGGGGGNQCGASKWAASKMANLQNKSSLINMLLLDATMPASGHQSTNRPQTDDEYNNNNSKACERPANVISQQLHISATSSPRGSLYPIATTDDADSPTGLGQLGPEQAQKQAGEQQQQTSLKVRKNLRSFFQSNSAKFNKLNNQNKRGLYLASVIYHIVPTASNQSTSRNQHNKSPGANVAAAAASTKPASDQAALANTRLVVTNDDRLPIIEIFNDLVAPSSLMADFHWLLKINGTNWIDMKRLRQQLQRSHSSSTLHLRIKLLAAIEQMQLALNLEDIGRLFYKPIQAHDGSIVICTCRSVSDTKQVSNLSIKWTNQHKIIPRHLRKIYEMIAQANKQRERHQEEQTRPQQQQQQQQQQQPQQQQPPTRSSLASSSQLQANSQQFGLNKRHSSSAMSGTGAVQAPQRPVTGVSSDNLLVVGQSTQVAPTEGSSPKLSTTTTSLTPAPSDALAGGGGEQQLAQAPNTRLLYANIGSLPPEINRLCEFCQQALIQRRCTMTSASSSSSLASNESQSWSSSQFSINSQQALGSASRTCTCSRSNSSLATSATTNQLRPNAAFTLGTIQQTQTAGVYGSLSGSGPPSQPISAPPSQRNSTSQASRPASGSMGMVMMMMTGGQTTGQQQQQQQQQIQSHSQQFQSSGSFSFASNQPARDNTSSTGSVSGPLSCSNPTSGRQTQSQQLSASDPLGPYTSSTYLMLASLSLYDLLLFHMREIIEFDQASTAPLRRGLYLGFIQLQTTVESMRLLVPRRRPNMLPCARIRDNAHVSREEWELLKRFASIAATTTTECEQTSGLPLTNGRLVVNTNRASKISVPTTVIDPSVSPPSNSTGSRSSDPAIWRPRPLGEHQSKQLEQQLQAQAKLQSDQQIMQQNLLSSSSRNANGDGFERDRAKSVSPGLIRAGATDSGGGYRSSIERAQMLANASKNQHQHHHQQQDLLKPTVYSGSCQINQCQGSATASDTAQAHAHSDTDLPLSLSTGAIPHAGPQRAATAGEFGETRLAADPGCEGAISDQQLHHQSASDSNLTEPAQQSATRSSAASSRKRASVCSISAHQLSQQQSPEMTFVRLIGDAARRLLLELKAQLPKVFDPTRQELVSVLDSLNDQENNRVYHMDLIELSNQVTFILLIPSPENVCPVTSNERSNILAHHPEYMLLPLQIFETIHLGTYEPDLLGKYSRLSTILETDLIVAQHDHRQAFSSNELKSTKSRVSHLQDMVAIADEFWRQLRWIVDVVSFARDKSQMGATGSANQSSADGSGGGGGSVRLAAIWRHFDRLASYPMGSMMWPRGGVDSLGMFPSRKSVESVVRSLQEGDNDNQQDASSSCSLTMQEHNQARKSPLLKTNSSGSTDDNQARRSMAAGLRSSGQVDWTGSNGHIYRQEIGRTSSVGLDRSRPVDIQAGDEIGEIGNPARALTRQLPEIKLPNKVTGRDEPTSDVLERPTIRDHDDENVPEQAKRLSRGPEAGRRQNKPNCDSDSHDASGYGVEAHSWQVTANNRDRAQRSNQLAEEQILNIKFSDRDHELVLIEQDEGKFAGDRIESETDRDKNDGNNNNAAGAGHMRHPVDNRGGREGERNDGDDDDDGEAAIYAYHISLRDATKAAAKRKSSQQLINLFIDRNNSSERPPVESNDKEELDQDEASTCGGLNVDRRQLELLRLAALTKAKSRVKLQLGDSGEEQRSKDCEALARNEFFLGLGDVKAYKFRKVPQKHPEGSRQRAAPNEARRGGGDISELCGTSSRDDASGSGSPGNRLVDDIRSQATQKESPRKTSQFKSTNPFLTDSFDL